MNAFEWPVEYGYAALDLLLAERISEGLDRAVYGMAIDQAYVVKVQKSDNRGGFQNMREWLTWQAVEGTPHAKWFCPCLWISACGRILTQRRTAPLVDLPRQVPGYFTDLKRDNWGLLDGKPVCHDYGVNLLMDHGLNVRAKNAVWR